MVCTSFSSELLGQRGSHELEQFIQKGSHFRMQFRILGCFYAWNRKYKSSYTENIPAGWSTKNYPFDSYAKTSQV